jgi:hypothetical protein
MLMSVSADIVIERTVAVFGTGCPWGLGYGATSPSNSRNTFAQVRRCGKTVADYINLTYV